MNPLDSIQRDLLVEGLEDYVGLWEVAKDVRRLYGEIPPGTVHELVMQRIRPLLREGLIVPGLPTEGGRFSAWDCDADSAVNRIDAEWSKLGRDPNIWEVCWFKNTDKGNELAMNMRS